MCAIVHRQRPCLTNTRRCVHQLWGSSRCLDEGKRGSTTKAGAALHLPVSMALFTEMTAISGQVKSGGCFQTKEFLQTCEKVVEMTTHFGSVFAVVQKDISKNISILQAKLRANETAYKDLFAMVGQVLCVRFRPSPLSGCLVIHNAE